MEGSDGLSFDRGPSRTSFYVSTRHLPEPDTVQQLMTDAHNRFKSNGKGAA